jgi:hypothetical protein
MYLVHSKRHNVRKLADFIHVLAMVKVVNSYFIENYQNIIFTKMPITTYFSLGPIRVSLTPTIYVTHYHSVPLRELQTQRVSMSRNVDF